MTAGILRSINEAREKRNFGTTLSKKDIFRGVLSGHTVHNPTMLRAVVQQQCGSKLFQINSTVSSDSPLAEFVSGSDDLETQIIRAETFVECCDGCSNVERCISFDWHASECIIFLNHHTEEFEVSEMNTIEKFDSENVHSKHDDERNTLESFGDHPYDEDEFDLNLDVDDSPSPPSSSSSSFENQDLQIENFEENAFLDENEDEQAKNDDADTKDEKSFDEAFFGGEFDFSQVLDKEEKDIMEEMNQGNSEGRESAPLDPEMLRLMQQFSDKQNMTKVREEEALQHEQEIKERNAEHILDMEQYLEVGKMRLRDIIPTGEYTRVTSRDPFYAKHSMLSLRYRSRKELHTVQKEMADAFSDVTYMPIGLSGDRKKPQRIMSLRVGNPKTGKHLFVVGSMRGCEWTSSLGIIHTAMALKGRVDSTRKMLQLMQIHFVAIANPDGFDYSHYHTPSSARSWCKNRHVSKGAHGVDLDRNWGTQGENWGFGDTGSHASKKTDYQGPEPFSEPESQALRSYMQHYATGPGRAALLEIRCCGGEVVPPQLYPSRANSTPAVNVNIVAKSFANQLKVTDGTEYATQKRKTQFDSESTGQMIDWAYNEAHMENAYILEMKGTGLSTRADKTKISVEPMQTYLRELETGVVFMAQKLLQQPIEGGTPVDTDFKVHLDETLQEESESQSKSKKK